MLKVECKTARCGGVRFEIGGAVAFETLPGLERIGPAEGVVFERLVAAVLRACGKDAYAATDGPPRPEEDALSE